MYSSITPIFSHQSSQTCPLIFLSHFSYFISLYPFALLLRGFDELYFISFDFFLFFSYHILILKSTFMYSQCQRFFFGSVLNGQLQYILLLLSDICSSFTCHVLFTLCMGSLFSKSHFFSLFISFFLTWEACTFLIVYLH